MSLRDNYYVSSFFWSTFQKVLTAIVGFVSVPLLLGFYGKAEYGILGIATACNSYMQLLDLGMNTGAVKYFAQWRTEGKKELVARVARTNITFYFFVALLNMAILTALAVWGEGLFSVSHDEFLLLRKCLLIISAFCVFSWGATTFNQLLVANMQMAFTMKMQCVTAILKALLIGLVFVFNWPLHHYFFFLTMVVALLVIPYAVKCLQLKILDSIRPATYWNEFRVVIMFSMSIFALSLFQMTATHSRPIILGIFAERGADAVAEFRIIEVIPLLIITVCGTFSAIFLPKASELVVKGVQEDISRFAYKWTVYTTLISCMLCFPVILCGREIISAYVGSQYGYLDVWLMIWTVCVLLQVHSTPTNALVLAYGKTKMLVIVSASACVVSIIINAILAKSLGVGAAIVGYSVYIVINLCCYYGYYFKNTLKISRTRIFGSFFLPALIGGVALMIGMILSDYLDMGTEQTRLDYLLAIIVKSIIWGLLFVLLVWLSGIVRVKGKALVTRYD